MPSIVEALRERVDQTRSELEKAKQATAEAQAREAALESDLEAFMKAQEAEERRQGIKSGVSPTSMGFTDHPLHWPLGNLEDIPKSEHVRRILKAHTKGITPLDLLKELQGRGILIGTNYVYALLHRFKNDELITKKGKKFYWIGNQEIKASGAVEGASTG